MDSLGRLAISSATAPPLVFTARSYKALFFSALELET